MQDIVTQLPRIEPVPTRPLTAIDGIAIHHAADEGTPQAWARYHTSSPENNGPSWGPANSIGYHVAILRGGLAYKCAYDRDQTPGVANENHHLIHVVLQGDFTRTLPDPAQIRTLLVVCRQYQQAYSIPTDRVRGHQEWVTDPVWATGCPGIARLGAHVRFMLSVGM